VVWILIFSVDCCMHYDSLISKFKLEHFHPPVCNNTVIAVVSCKPIQVEYIPTRDQVDR
jgi:hypothetical protein